MKQEFKISRSKFDELQAELNYLKTTRSNEVEARIKAARDLGDLSENPEYDDAREEKAYVITRIDELEHILLHAVIVEEGGMPAGRG